MKFAIYNILVFDAANRGTSPVIVSSHLCHDEARKAVDEWTLARCRRESFSCIEGATMYYKHGSNGTWIKIVKGEVSIPDGFIPEETIDAFRAAVRADDPYPY